MQTVHGLLLKRDVMMYATTRSRHVRLSASGNTVACRVDEMASELQIQLKTKAKEFVLYLLTADESIDTMDTAQVSRLIQGGEWMLSFPSLSNFCI